MALSRLLTESGDGLLLESGSNLLVELQLLQDLTEDWSSGIDSTKWFNWGGSQVTVVNQELHIASSLIADYNGIESFTTYTLTGSYAVNRLKDRGNQEIRSWEIYPVYVIDHEDATNQLFWLVTSDDRLLAYKRLNGINFVLRETDFDVDIHKWFRIRETSGLVYFEFSTDGETWDIFTDLADPFNMDLVIAGFQAGTWQTEGTQTEAIFDNWNMVVVTTDTPTETIFGNFPGFYLNDIKVKMPNKMTSDFVFLKTDYTAINGRTSRDMDSMKQKWILTIDNLTVLEVERIYAIIELNRAVTFSFNGRDQLVIQTSVWPYVGAISYDMVGSDYRAKIQLELIEVQ